jgi:hypothetical protein
VITARPHQIWYSIEQRNDRDFAELNPRCGTREAHKNQTVDHCQAKHARHDLEHGNQVPVQSFRIHVAVADSRERFHAEEKSVGKRAGRHLGDGMWPHHVQRGKYKIDEEIDAENNTGEPRPAQGQDQMVCISPIELLGIELNKFELPVADPDPAWTSPHN